MNQQMSSESKRFLEIFPELASHRCGEAFEEAEVLRVEAFRKTRRLVLYLRVPRLVRLKTILDAQQRITDLFSMEEVIIKPRFEIEGTIGEKLSRYWDDMLMLMGLRVALTRGMLAGATWETEDRQLIVKLKSNGSFILKRTETDLLMEQLVEDFFGERLRVIFHDADFAEDADRYFEEKDRKEAEAVNRVVAVSEAVPEPEALIVEKADKTKKSEVKAEAVAGPVILGKDFNDELIPMNEVSQDSGRVAICGDVFRIETRETKSGKMLVIFDMSDGTSSLTVKFFMDKEKYALISGKVKNGARFRVRGDAQYDKFSRELGIFACDIVETKKAMKMDNAPEKRVELHLHTQMSNMDGVTSATDLVKRAAAWGHKAIAITDHGVVQAYPDAFATGKKNNIKIIYGVEAYLLDDDIPAVYQPAGQKLNDSYVVFDIETTGLNSEKDKITEIGAVKICNGQIVDTFASFVNPEIPIPAMITKLTGIRDDMVAGSPVISEVIPEFLRFVGNAVLVAHNAPFDIGFMKVAARRKHLKLPETVVDTLALSRCMYPQLGKYKLNVLAEHLGIKLVNHHRAVDDATATAEIFLRMCDALRERQVENLDQIVSAFDTTVNYKKAKTHHAIILVKNQTGLKNLYKIISASHIKYYHKRPRVPKSLLMQHREGLILGSACEAGELYEALVQGKSEEDISKIVRFYDYLEIQPIGNNRFMIANGTVRGEKDLENFNKKIVRLGEKHRKPVVATCDVHFIDPQDEVFRRILMAGKGFSDADNQAPLFFRTTQEMLDEFAYLGPEKAFEVVVTNTNLIADMTDEIAPVPSGAYPPKLEGAEEEIEKLSYAQARAIYGDELPQIVQERLTKELNSIIKNGFSVMYLIAQKLVQKSVSDGYLVGSRGSVGSSFVANMIGITEVNSMQPHYICTDPECRWSEFFTKGEYECGFDMPERDCPKCGKPLKKDGYDIPFETFLGFDGDKAPDIDLNFSGEYQSTAHKYTEELFGEGHVFRAGTIATVADKTAFGYVKKYLDERNRIVTMAEMNRLSSGCTGIKRTTGQHPGGIMIVPQDMEIEDFSPIQRPADDQTSDVVTTHFDYHFLHDSILKLDILGHDDPTMIRMLEQLTGVNAREIPIGEAKTMSLFSSTEALNVTPEEIDSDVGTYAVPEFGTKFVRQMLVDTKPTMFSELIRISGLSHGTDVWLNNAQDLIRAGTCTLSEAICCRDDIMIYLILQGLPPKTAFKIMEDVRKGKGVKDEYEVIMKENNVPEWYIQSCKTIKYMFPKAHAAAYVMMAFRIAWFKVYYPEAFYCAYFTVRADSFDAESMTAGPDRIRLKIKEIEAKGKEATQKESDLKTVLEVALEMTARGIRFLPVDLFRSHAVKFQITQEGLLPPFNALQGLGEAAAFALMEAASGGDYLSKDEVRLRAKVSTAVITILDQAGCLFGLPESNQLTLF